MDDLAGSEIFDPDTGFGGEGGDCVTDGPFVNLTLHMSSSSTSDSYCLSRSLNSNGFQTGAQEYIDECYNTDTYEEAFECYQVNPHTAGHSAVGGVVSDTSVPIQIVERQILTITSCLMWLEVPVNQSFTFIMPTWIASGGSGSKPTSPPA
jgi:hypothetical protein